MKKKRHTHEQIIRKLAEGVTTPSAFDTQAAVLCMSNTARRTSLGVRSPSES